MTDSAVSYIEFLATVSPFNQLPESVLREMNKKIQPVRFNIGDSIIIPDRIPSHIFILYQGQARLIAIDPRSQKPITLQKLESGAIIGGNSLIRKVYHERAIASTEVECLTLSAPDFLNLLEKYPNFSQALQTYPSEIEVFEALGTELQRQADGSTSLAILTRQALPQSVITYPQKRETLDPAYLWVVSGGRQIPDCPIGSEIIPEKHFKLIQGKSLRLVGIPRILWEKQEETSSDSPSLALRPPIPHASEQLPSLDSLPIPKEEKVKRHYPFVGGKGAIKETLACFNMLSRYFNVPFHQEVLKRVITNQSESGELSLPFCAALADVMGLQAQLIAVQADSFPRLPCPFLVRLENSFALIYDITKENVTIALPNVGLRRRKLSTILDVWGQTGQVLLLSVGSQTPSKKFGISWFIPILLRYRRVLFEVLIAAFVVQLFGLANPLMTQVIIDQVIGGNNLDALHVIGILLIFIAAFEAILGTVRTFLFSDTTNRIDLTLGTQVIDHLLRLPMSYFGRRTVGELATRVQELEKIRQFLTGTALTVVLDAIFSVLYIIVMIIYSPLLTLVALSIVPVYIVLTLIFSPILRRMLRTQAERNAETHSYLVEILSGMETVKSQTIELQSRMSWQQRYANYVSSGFKALKLSTVVGSFSDFLNKTSSLLVLWVGAYLVLKDDSFSLGQLIAFRIISGYVTSPLLRLAQLWQNFQETALSIERLGDILNHNQEEPPEARNTLPMPAIKGEVIYQNISFRFAQSGPLQLTDINLTVPAGSFVGIVGQSGSGKSTLTKLLPRFYEPLGGRILVDGYEIDKVELYSLRRQMGIVPQNPLLFEGTILENIALNNPDATTEDIIEAAIIADAHEFISNLPQGYNTQVGERGGSLSGGQRQRIAIARTVLQNPRLLILDEATSALDYETEQRVCDNLMQKFKGKTVFFITHRLSTLNGADIIIFMANGVIEEMGTHEELMAMQGRYYCLYH